MRIFTEIYLIYLPFSLYVFIWTFSLFCIFIENPLSNAHSMSYCVQVFMISLYFPGVVLYPLCFFVFFFLENPYNHLLNLLFSILLNILSFMSMTVRFGVMLLWYLHVYLFVVSFCIGICISGSRALVELFLIPCIIPVDIFVMLKWGVVRKDMRFHCCPLSEYLAQ